MILVLVLTGIFLILVSVSGVKKFQLYGLLTALIFTVLSIEMLADIDGLTLGVLSALTMLTLPYINMKVYDAIGCIIITLPCLFWLNTQEFVDGFAYSLIFVALGAALACNLLFGKQKRQTLCALVLLTSFVICNLSNVYFSVTDTAFAFLIAMIFSYSFEYQRRDFEQDAVIQSNQTLSIDLMTIDS